jgi:predicted Fe-Mo cluster-binding NifX family protein
MLTSLFGVTIVFVSITTQAVSNASNIQDIPVTKNPIVNNAKTKGVTIVQTWVQDNVDPLTAAPIADRLQLKISNTTSKAISNLEIFYTMKDSVTNAAESYYKKLNGYTLPAKKISYLYFDNMKAPGHFSENKYSIYRSSNNEVKFTIELSAKGFVPQFSTAIKAKGTTENPNG